MIFNGAPPKKQTVLAVYAFLTGKITRYELAEQAGTTRTNLYFIIARVVLYWLHTGTLKFSGVRSDEDLGGRAE